MSDSTRLGRSSQMVEKTRFCQLFFSVHLDETGFPLLSPGLQVWYVRARGLLFWSVAILSNPQQSSAILKKRSNPQQSSTIPSNPQPQQSLAILSNPRPAILSNPQQSSSQQSSPSNPHSNPQQSPQPQTME